jgi:hypothetical protein
MVYGYRPDNELKPRGSSIITNTLNIEGTSTYRPESAASAARFNI